MIESKDILRETLVDAVMEADGGPDDERWEAENMVDDFLDTPSGRDVRLEIEQGKKAQAILRLVVMRHHGPDDINACDVCAGAMSIWGGGE